MLISVREPDSGKENSAEKAALLRMQPTGRLSGGPCAQLAPAAQASRKTQNRNGLRWGDPGPGFGPRWVDPYGSGGPCLHYGVRGVEGGIAQRGNVKVRAGKASWRRCCLN